MNLEEEKRFLLLASVQDIGGQGSKQQVLDNIEHRGYISLNAHDLDIKHNRNEVFWRNDLAFIRKHLVDNDYLDGSIRNTWGLTDKGELYLQELADKVIAARSSNRLRKLTIHAIRRAQNLTEAKSKPEPARNPAWVRDEVVLALDLYFRHHPSSINKNHPAVIELSELLNNLNIHSTHASDFRNPNGVYMKMGNFLSLDPKYSGVGLKGVSKLDQVIWEEFAYDREYLKNTAAAIRNNYQLVKQPPDQSEEEETEFTEGRVLTRVHHLRERNRAVVEAKKKEVLKKTGKLLCEVCKFDFEAKYGSHGKEFAECHHTKPLSTFQANDKTKPSDLAIVCSNCHRMLHRGKRMMSIEELRAIVERRRAKA